MEPFTTGWTGKAVETVGISGSGKTMLAAEVVEHSRDVDPTVASITRKCVERFRCATCSLGSPFICAASASRNRLWFSVQCGPAEEEALARLARAYSALSQEVSLLVDLVDGTCSLAFARDLATFIRALSPSAFRIAVLGQESGLRELTAAERQDHGVMRLDLRGFRFEEFVLLVGHHHANADRAVLWDIYQRVTAGRPAGLFAKLAHWFGAGGIAGRNVSDGRKAGRRNTGARGTAAFCADQRRRAKRRGKACLFCIAVPAAGRRRSIP